MGHIHESHGVISVEERRESFIIHAGYGWRAERRVLNALTPGDHFRRLNAASEAGIGDQIFQVHGVDIDGVNVRPADSADIPARADDPSELVVPVTADGRPVDSERFSCPLGVIWSRQTHPEFEYADLDDLIRALTEMRASVGSAAIAETRARQLQERNTARADSA